MRYLGRMDGDGELLRNGDAVARASYDFEGFLGPRGVVMSSGEIVTSPAALELIAATAGVQLRTDDGRLLNLKLSDQGLGSAAGVAQVEVSGDLPRSPAEWRGRAILTPTLATSEA
jgi:hypothetical protein